jgi:hypothetical protein
MTQEDFVPVELIAPDDDGLEGEGTLAQPGDHRFAPSLDTFGDGDFAFAGEQVHRPDLAHIQAHWIVDALGRRLGIGFGRHLLPHLDQFPAFGLDLVALLLLLVGCLFGFDHIDTHFGEHRQHVLDLLGIDFLRQ